MCWLRSWQEEADSIPQAAWSFSKFHALKVWKGWIQDGQKVKKDEKGRFEAINRRLILMEMELREPRRTLAQWATLFWWVGNGWDWFLCCYTSSRTCQVCTCTFLYTRIYKYSIYHAHLYCIYPYNVYIYIYVCICTIPLLFWLAVSRFLEALLFGFLRSLTAVWLQLLSPRRFGCQWCQCHVSAWTRRTYGVHTHREMKCGQEVPRDYFFSSHFVHVSSHW